MKRLLFSNLFNSTLLFYLYLDFQREKTHEENKQVREDKRKPFDCNVKKRTEGKKCYEKRRNYHKKNYMKNE
jgi:hypothetical protein